MKLNKQITTLLLTAALLTSSLTACDTAKADKDDTRGTTTDTTDTSTETTESETSAEKKPVRLSPDFFNGVWGNSNVTYTFNQNGELSVHIADWDESHLFTSLAGKNVAVSKYFNAAIGVNNERAFLLLKRYDANKINVVNFEKGSTSETVVNLDVDEDVYEVCGNFINENIGYLFTFKEVLEGHSRGGSKLSNLLKTEDGGKTWDSINIQNVSSISLQNHIMFAKMISEDVGLISGNIFGDDYDFCERTLLTTDGGLNWVFVNVPELPQDDDLHWAKVADFARVDDSYILTIRYETPSGDDDYAKYRLRDSNTWVRINE